MDRNEVGNSLRAAEDCERWNCIVATSPVVPRRPSGLYSSRPIRNSRLPLNCRVDNSVSESGSIPLVSVLFYSFVAVNRIAPFNANGIDRISFERRYA